MSRIKFGVLVLAMLLPVVGCSRSTAESLDSSQAKSSGNETPDVHPKTKPTETDVPAEGSPAGSLFVVDHYDPERDPAADLNATIQLAVKAKKRILLEIGGKW